MFNNKSIALSTFLIKNIVASTSLNPSMCMSFAACKAHTVFVLNIL